MGMQAYQHAPILQVLFASGAHISSFGAARGIRHLVLQMRDLHCGHFSAAVSVLEQLETLWLADATGGGVQPHTSGALQLFALKSLRSLALACVVPESISCNDSCELHLELHTGWSMEHPVWDMVLPRLRTVRLSATDLVALPSILLNAGNLTRAKVNVNQCGTSAAPLLLGGSLAHVEELMLLCREVHAVVPAHVTWRNFLVAATHMDLRFEAVASFGEAIPAFCFVFTTLQVRYPQPILKLFMAVTVNPAPRFALCAGCSAH